MTKNLTEEFYADGIARRVIETLECIEIYLEELEKEAPELYAKVEEYICERLDLD